VLSSTSPAAWKPPREAGERREHRRVTFLDLFCELVDVLLILAMLVRCGPSTEYLEAVDYTPLLGDDRKVSISTEQGLD